MSKIIVTDLVIFVKVTIFLTKKSLINESLEVIRPLYQLEFSFSVNPENMGRDLATKIGHSTQNIFPPHKFISE